MENSGLQLQPHEISFCSIFTNFTRNSWNFHKTTVHSACSNQNLHFYLLSSNCIVFYVVNYFVLTRYFYLSINLFSVELHASTNL